MRTAIRHSQPSLGLERTERTFSELRDVIAANVETRAAESSPGGNHYRFERHAREHIRYPNLAREIRGGCKPLGCQDLCRRNVRFKVSHLGGDD